MESPNRMNRRLVGMLRARLPEAKLDEVADPRKTRGRRWPIATLLLGVLVAILAGAKSLAQAEKLTAEMSPAVRRPLGLKRRIADTTMRDLLCVLAPMELRRCLHRLVRAAYRRKALTPDRLPFGIIAMDGKDTALPSCDDHYAQRQTQKENGGPVGMLRTMTCTLISSTAKVCLDAIPIPAQTNEMGHFAAAFTEVVAAYGSIDLFRLLSYDAGACSLENATLVHEHFKRDYLFGLKASQPTLFAEAKRLLETLPTEQAVATSEDVVGDGIVHRRVFLTETMAGFHGWTHLQTVVRIEAEKRSPEGKRLTYENRYYIASLKRSELSDAQWLRVVRLHWGVENNCHNTFDTAFEEDDHPWIEADPQGALAVLLLRRMAYTLLALFRTVTQRTEERRGVPWVDLIRGVYNALLAATADQLRSLRVRPIPVPV